MKLLKKIRKGFTLIELVVVIAVIAILAAVSVVSYVSITNKAKQSNDQQKIDQVNLSLAALEVSGKPETMYEAVKAVEEDGFKPENFKAEAKDYTFAYKMSENRFVILKKGSIVYPKDIETPSAKADLWQFSDKGGELTDGYSYYLRGTGITDSVTVAGGLDVGDNASVPSVSYSSTESQDVVIRTNNASCNVFVSGSETTAKHYGVGNIAYITSVDKAHSYHEYGSLSALHVKEGKVVVEEDGFVGKIGIDSEATSSDVTIDNKGFVFETEVVTYTVSTTGTVTVTPYEGEATAATTIVDNVPTTSTDDYILIGTAESLVNLANAQSQGVIGGPLKIRLTKNIDLTGQSWVPFGADIGTFGSGDSAKPISNAFEGEFDGNNHSITGLSNGSYRGIQTQNSSTPFVGENYGFFANVKGTVEIKNLKFEDVNIIAKDAKICGVLIATTRGYDINHNESNVSSLTLNNVDVAGESKIIGKDKVGGLIGYAVSYSSTIATMNVLDCDVEASVKIDSESGYRIGGLIGQIGDYSKVYIKDGTSFKGSVTLNTSSSKIWSGAITGYLSQSSYIYVSGFTVQGEITAASNPTHSKVVDSNGVCMLLSQQRGEVISPMNEVAVASSWKIEYGATPDSWVF